MISFGFMGKCFLMSSESFSSLIFPVPNVLTWMLTGAAMPMAYASCISHLSASPAPTTFLAMYRAV